MISKVTMGMGRVTKGEKKTKKRAATIGKVVRAEQQESPKH